MAVAPATFLADPAAARPSSPPSRFNWISSITDRPAGILFGWTGRWEHSAMAFTLSRLTMPFNVWFAWLAFTTSDWMHFRAANRYFWILCITDAIDGAVARRSKSKGKGAGAWVDPIVDKIFFGLALLLVWMVTYRFLTPQNVMAFAACSIISLGGEAALWYVRQENKKNGKVINPTAGWMGKVKFCLQCSVAATAMHYVPRVYAGTFSITTLTTIMCIELVMASAFAVGSLRFHLARARA
jgi:phosphatidylglycerophosphate synthase